MTSYPTLARPAQWRQGLRSPLRWSTSRARPRHLALGLFAVGLAVGLLVSPGWVLAQSSPNAQAASSSAGCPSLLRHQFPRLQDDQPQNLCQYQGKVVMVVNTASFCGYTSQFKGLEQLFEQQRGRGFVILGFPSNDFGGQDPGSNREIAAFCENTYGVKFPMMAKSSVRGAQANPLFRMLAQQAGAPGWNFHKYLIDRDGRLAGSFTSSVAPNDPALLRKIDSLLAQSSQQKEVRP